MQQVTALDIDDLSLAEELSLWSLDLGVLAVRAGELHEGGYTERSDEAWKMLRRALGTLIGTTQKWANTPAKARRHWAAELRTVRTALIADLDALPV